MKVDKRVVVVLMLISLISIVGYSKCSLQIYAYSNSTETQKLLESCDVNCYDTTTTCTHQISSSDCFDGSGDYYVQSRYYVDYALDSASDWKYGYTCNIPETTATAVDAITGHSYSFGTWSKHNVNVTLSCSPSDNCETYYCVDDSDTCSPNELYSTPFQVTCQSGSNCDKFVRYYSKNNNWQEDVKRKEIKIDKIPPTLISYHIDGCDYSNNGICWVKGNKMFFETIKYMDAGSGPKSQYLSFTNYSCTPNHCGCSWTAKCESGNEIKSHVFLQSRWYRDDMYNDDYLNIEEPTNLTSYSSGYEEERWPVTSGNISKNYKIWSYEYDEASNGHGYDYIGNLSVDADSPKTTINANSYNHVAENHYDFSLSCHDIGSGCNNTYYKIVNSADNCGTTGYTEGLQGTVSSCESNVCSKKVCYYSDDNVRNIESVNQSIFDFSKLGIEILTPRNGDVLISGNSYKVSWRHYGEVDNFDHYDVYAYDSEGNKYEIGTLDDIDYSFVYWTAPSPNTDMEEFTLYVDGYDSSGSLIGRGVQKIKITNEPHIKITQPSNGEIIQSEDNYEIKWKSNNLQTGKIRILFYNGTGWEFLAWNLPLDDNSYMWNVPDKECDNCKLRVGDYSPSSPGSEEGDWVTHDGNSLYDTVNIGISNLCGNGNLDSGEVCDPPGYSCSHYIDGDYCYYGGTCSDNCGSCAGAQHDYCPSPGTTKNGKCYYGGDGDARCNDDGCQLSVCDLQKNQYCDAVNGCTNNEPNPPDTEKLLDVKLVLTDNYPKRKEFVYGIIFVREWDKGVWIKKSGSDTTIDEVTVDGRRLPDVKWSDFSEEDDNFENMCEDMAQRMCSEHENELGEHGGYWKNYLPKFAECSDGKIFFKNGENEESCEQHYQKLVKSRGINLGDYYGYWFVPINTTKYHSTVTAVATSDSLTGAATATYQLTDGLETVVYIPAPSKYEVPLAELDGQYYGNFSRGQAVDFIAYGKVYKNGVAHTCSNCIANYTVYEGTDMTTKVDNGTILYNAFDQGYDGNVSTKQLACDKWYTLEVNMTDSADGWDDSSVNYFYVDCTPRLLIKSGGRITYSFSYALNESDVNMFTVEVYNPNDTRQNFALELSSNNNPSPLTMFGINFVSSGRDTISIPTNGFSSNETEVHMNNAARAGTYDINVILFNDNEEVNRKNVKVSVFAEGLTEFVTKSLVILMIGAGAIYLIAR